MVTMIMTIGLDLSDDALYRQCARKFFNEDIGLSLNTHAITTFDLREKVTSDYYLRDSHLVSELTPEVTTHAHIEQAQYLAILRLDIGLRYWQDIVGSLLPTCHVHSDIRD
eukprot:sb/3477178/